MSIFLFVAVPTGNVTFKRQLLKDFPRWDQSQSDFTRVHVTSRGSIEDDGLGMLQVYHLTHDTWPTPTWLASFHPGREGGTSHGKLSYNPRNSSKLRMPIVLTEYYHWSFLISGCNAWNNLPDYIWKSVSLNCFKFNMFKYL